MRVAVGEPGKLDGMLPEETFPYGLVYLRSGAEEEYRTADGAGASH